MISDIDRGISGDSSVEDPMSYRIDKYSVDLTRRLLFRQRYVNYIRFYRSVGTY